MSKFFSSHWDHIRGNVKYDILKWFIGSVIASGASSEVLRYFLGMPLKVSLSMGFLLALFFYFVLKIIFSFAPRSHATIPDPKPELAGTTNIATPREESKGPKNKLPILVSKKAVLVEVGYSSDKVCHAINTKTEGYWWGRSHAIVIEYYNKPLGSRSVPSLKAIIEVTNAETAHSEVIKQGVWLERYLEDSSLDTGSFLELGVGLVEGGKFYLLEWDHLKSYRPHQRTEETLRQIHGTEFRIRVELIAKDGFGTVLLTKIFHYRMILGNLGVAMNEIPKKPRSRVKVNNPFRQA